MVALFNVLIVAALVIMVFCAVLGILANIFGGFSPTNRAFVEIAKRYYGTARTVGLTGKKQVRFPYGEVSFELSATSSSSVGRREATVLRTVWPDFRFVCQVATKGTIANLATDQTQDSQAIGDGTFDEEFELQSNRPHAAVRLLSEGARMELTKLKLFHYPEEVAVSFHYGRLSICKPGRLSTFNELDAFVQMGLSFYDQLMLTRSVGIEFQEGDGSCLVDEAVCQVCGDTITTDMVFCSRCQTPHHLECWQYNGNCTTYGCKETRYVAPRLHSPEDGASFRSHPKPR